MQDSVFDIFPNNFRWLPSTQKRSKLLPCRVASQSAIRSFIAFLYAISACFLASAAALASSYLARSSASLASRLALIASSFTFAAAIFYALISSFFLYFSASISSRSFLIRGSLSYAVSTNLRMRARSALTYLARRLLFSCSMYLRS